MEKNENEFADVLKLLLNERLSDAEAQSLKDEGFKLKSPKRKTAVMIALYKKAAAGDLSAIKELRGILGTQSQLQESGAVTIIDNITG